MSPTILKEEKDQQADVSLFVDYGNLLLGLNSHLICTVPIRLLNMPIGRKLHEDFSQVFILPVRKMREKETNAPYAQRIMRFSEILQKRMDGLSGLEGKKFFGDDENLLELMNDADKIESADMGEREKSFALGYMVLDMMGEKFLEKLFTENDQ